MPRLADVVTLPVRQATTITGTARHTVGTVTSGARHTVGSIADTARSTVGTLADTARHTFDALAGWSVDEIDDWGRDPTLVVRAHDLMQLRWRVAVNGHERLPKRNGALIVVNARRFALAPVFTALATGAALGRPVRFVGRPDMAPVGPLLQRLGGLLDRPDEIRGALAAGELVVVGAEPTPHARRVGHVHHASIGAAIAAGAKVFPAATASAPLQRAARVEIGAELRPNRRRRGPLIELELADDAESAIQHLLDELGGPITGTPLDWLPLSGMGGT